MSEAILRFHPGRIVATAAVDAFSKEHTVDLARLLTRHLTGDWGEIDDHDREVNEKQLLYGVGRVMSAYHVKPDDTTIWIITDFVGSANSDDNITTFLFPSDY